MAKSKINKRKMTRWISVGIVIAIIYTGVVFIRQQMQIIDQNDQIAVAQEELATLQADNDQLAENVDNARSNENVEKVAREKLNMVKEGEILFSEAPNQ